MNVWSAPNSVWDREYTVPSGGLAMQSEHGGLGFAEDIGKVMVCGGHTSHIGGIDRRRSGSRVELCIFCVDIKCEAHCSWKFGGVCKHGSAYQ